MTTIIIIIVVATIVILVPATWVIFCWLGLHSNEYYIWKNEDQISTPRATYNDWAATHKRCKTCGKWWHRSGAAWILNFRNRP